MEGDQVADLVRLARGLGADELAVLLFVAERLHGGREQYGALTLRTDTRDFVREALEEAVDLVAYAAMHLVRAQGAA